MKYPEKNKLSQIQNDRLSARPLPLANLHIQDQRKRSRKCF